LVEDHAGCVAKPAGFVARLRSAPSGCGLAVAVLIRRADARGPGFGAVTDVAGMKYHSQAFEILEG